MDLRPGMDLTDIFRQPRIVIEQIYFPQLP